MRCNGRSAKPPVSISALPSFPFFRGQNPEHLLLFAAGNDGDLKHDADRNGVCTIGSPGTAKNVLTVGASSSGITRMTYTASDGSSIYDGTSDKHAGIDTVAYFSSYGFTDDGRIKPEIVAPGDQVCCSLAVCGRVCLVLSSHRRLFRIHLGMLSEQPSQPLHVCYSTMVSKSGHNCIVSNSSPSSSS